MKKKDVRVFLCQTADKLRVLDLYKYYQRKKLTVLTYHRVLPDALMNDYLFPSLAVPESVFARQIQFLSKQYCVVGLEEGIEILTTGHAGDKPLVAITFDDGYSDNWFHAVPVLEKFGVRATFYVVSDLIGTDQSLWYDIAARCWQTATPRELFVAVDGMEPSADWLHPVKPTISEWMAHLKSLSGIKRMRVLERLVDPGPTENRQHLDRVMSSPQLRELVRLGHQIGSHTCTHPLLPQLDDESLERELQKSRHDLEGHLNMEVRSFCYPNGDYDARVLRAVAAAGYRTSCTTVDIRNDKNLDRLKIGRINMDVRRSTNMEGSFHQPSFHAAVSSMF